MSNWKQISEELILNNLNNDALDTLIKNNVWAYDLQKTELVKKENSLNVLRNERLTLSNDVKSVDEWMNKRDAVRSDFRNAMNIKKNNLVAKFVILGSFKETSYYSFLSYKQSKMVLKNVKSGYTINYKGYEFVITNIESKNFKNSQPLQVTLELNIN